MKRYKERQKQFHDNNEFTNKPEKFYSKLRGTSIKVDKLPSKENIESFWKPIFETEKKYNKKCKWLQDDEKSINASKDEFQQISIKEINDATMKFSNWKSPGIDNIQNFW